jgi:hypothetical protein
MKPRRIGLLVAMLLATGASVAFPQTGETTREAPVQAAVPEGLPSSWPGGPWHAIPRAQGEMFLRQLTLPSKTAPSAVGSVQQAVYRGRLQADLLEGTAEWVVRNGSEPTAVNLGQLSLYLEDLRWPDRSADWGGSGDGASYVRVRPDDSALTGNWTQAGVRTDDRLQFNFRLTTSAISEMQLDVAEGLAVTCSTGLVERIDGAPEPALQRWRIQLGRRSRFELRIEPVPKPVPLNGAAREAVTATIHAEGVDIWLDLELAGRLPPTLEVALPHDLEITSATIGNEVPLPLRIRPDVGARRASLVLPATAALQGARVRLRAFRAARWGGMQPLALPDILNLEPLEHQLTLHVQRPLLLQDFRADGYLLTDQRVEGGQVETWMFQAMQPAAGLSVEIAAPEPQLSVDQTIWADYSADIPALTSRVQLRGGNGPAFRVRFEVPEGWDVVSVEPFRGATETIVSEHHTVPGDEGEASILTVEFRQPLASGDTRDLRIEALARSRLDERSAKVPMFLPLEGVAATGVIGINPPADVEAASSFTGLLPSLDQSRREQFLSLSEASTSGRAMFLSLPEAVASPQWPTVLFERPEAAVTSPVAADMEVPAAPRPAAAPATGDLEIITELAAAGAAAHLHSATFRLLEPFDGPLAMTLAERAEVSSLSIDGASIAFVRTGDEVRSRAPVHVKREITLQYRTAADFGWLVQSDVIPVPDSGGRIKPLTWIILANPTRACYGVETPFMTVVEEEAPHWTERVLGPLARVPPKAEQAPREPPGRSEAAWGATWDPNDGTGIRRAQTPVAPGTLSLSTWNPAVAARAAWCCLALVLLGGALLRRASSPGRPLRAAIILTALMTIAWFSPWPVASIGGAAVAAALVVALLPAAALRAQLSLEPGRSEAPSHSGSRISTRAATSASVGLIVGGLLAGSVDAQQPAQSESQSGTPTVADSSAGAPPEALLPESTENGGFLYLNSQWAERFRIWRDTGGMLPSWLIRNADYRLTIGEEPQALARFTILAPADTEETTVPIPLTSVSFASATDASVNGAPVTIIPSLDGSAVLLRIPAGGEEPVPSPDNGHWRSHVVEIRFRPEFSGNAGQGRLQFGIPALASATAEFEWPSSDAPEEFLCEGAQQSSRMDSSAGFRVMLGPAARIDARWNRADETMEVAPAPPSPTVATLVDVHPLRLDCRTILQWLPDFVPSSPFTVALPPGCVLTEVDAPAGATWESEPDESAVHIAFSFDQRQTGPPIQASLLYSVPIDASRDPDHALRLSSLVQIPGVSSQLWGFRATPGFHLTDVEELGSDEPVSVSPDEFVTQYSGRELDAPQLAYRMSSAEQVALALRPTPVKRIASLQQTLTVHRRGTEWSATAVVDVAVPTPIHDFRLDPRIELDAISVKHDDAERLARFSRNGEFVQLVLSRPYGGRQVIQMTGKLPTASGGATAVPTIGLSQAEVQSSTVQLINDSGWAVELSDEDRNWTVPADENGAPQVVASFDVGGVQTVRLLPGPDAATAESLTQILKTRDGSWLARVSGAVRPNDVPLTTVNVLVPPALSGELTINPRADLISSQTLTDGARRLQLKPSRLRGGAYRFAIQAALETPEAGVWEWPAVRFESASAGNSYLAVSRDFPFRPTSASSEAVPPARIAAGFPGQFLAANADAFRMLGDRWLWSRFESKAPLLRIPLVETRVWWNDSAVRGQSRLTVVNERSNSLLLQAPEGIQLLEASIGSTLLETIIGPEEWRVSLPPDLSGETLKIEWTADAQVWRDSAALSLPRVLNVDVPRSLCGMVLPGGARLHSERELTHGEVLTVRMEGLLEAIEAQSTRSFPLDSPLLERLRTTDAQLKSLSASSLPSGELLQTRRDELQQRWRRVHELISVESSIPGIAGHSSELAQADALPADAVWLPVDGKTASVPAPSRGTISSAIPAALLVAATFALWWLLLRSGVLAATSDWLRRRPGLALLAGGLAWAALLSPPAFGVLLMLPGLAILFRRRSRNRWNPDTALVGPGR